MTDKQTPGLHPARRWWQTKRVIIPAAVIGLIIILTVFGGDPEDAGDRTIQDSGDTGDTEELAARIADLEDELEAKETEIEQLEKEGEAAQERVDELEAEVDGTEEDPGESIEEEEEVEDEAGSQADTIDVGDTAQFNDWEFVVTDVSTTSSIDRADAPRGMFVVVMLQVTNQGNHERQVAGGYGDDFAVLDIATENEYRFDSRASLSYHHAHDTSAWHLEDIGPGLSGNVPIIFDVPEDTDGPLLFALISGDQLSSLVQLDL